VIPALGRVVLAAALILSALGLLLILHDRVPWLGRLPGDITIVRGGVRAPMTTCVVLSVVVSLVLWGISHLRK